MSEAQATTASTQSTESQVAKEVTKEIETLGAAMGPAFITWLKTLFYFIILPYKVWKTTTIRLAKSSSNGGAIIKNGEEFPMYTFLKVSFDATIFIAGILTVLFSIFGLLGILVSAVSTMGYLMIGLLAYAAALYFLTIPLLSFLNELISMRLVAVQKTAEIEKNTRK